MDQADYTGHQRQAFGDALRAARRGRSTSSIIDELPGYKSPGVISNWEAGATPPPPPVVFALEHILDLEPGHLSQHLGFLPVGTDAPPCTVETAISDDPALTPAVREILRNVYREFTRGSETR